MYKLHVINSWDQNQQIELSFVNLAKGLVELYMRMTLHYEKNLKGVYSLIWAYGCQNGYKIWENFIFLFNFY